MLYFISLLLCSVIYNQDLTGILNCDINYDLHYVLINIFSSRKPAEGLVVISQIDWTMYVFCKFILLILTTTKQ